MEFWAKTIFMEIASFLNTVLLASLQVAPLFSHSA